MAWLVAAAGLTAGVVGKENGHCRVCECRINKWNLGKENRILDVLILRRRSCGHKLVAYIKKSL